MIAYDNSSQGSTTTLLPNTASTFSHTNNGNCLIVAIADGDNNGQNHQLPSSVTYGGVAMTNMTGANKTISTYGYVNMWYLLNPPTGANNVSITFPTTGNGNGSSRYFAAAVSYNGVAQVNQPDSASNTSAGSGASLTQSTTTIAVNAWAVAIFMNNQGATMTAGTGTTSRQTGREGSSGESVLVGDSNAAITPPGSYSMACSTNSGLWLAAMISLAPIAYPFGDFQKTSMLKFLGKRPTLAASFLMDGNSRDNSGNGQDGTDTSMTYVPKGRFGRVAYFGGSSNIQAVTKMVPSGTVMSVSLWLYSLSESQAQDVTIFTNQNDTNTYGLIFSRNTATANSWGIFYGDGAGHWNTYNANYFTIPANQWHHFYCVVNGTSAKVYMNGKLIVSYSTANTVNFANSNKFMIGNDTYGATGRGFNGYMKNVEVILEELPEPVVAQFYAWANKKRRSAKITQWVQGSIVYVRTASVSMMNSASRLATVARLFVGTRSASMTQGNAASRTQTVTRTLTLVRSASATIMNAAGRLATVAYIKSVIMAIRNAVRGNWAVNPTGEGRTIGPKGTSQQDVPRIDSGKIPNSGS